MSNNPAVSADAITTELKPEITQAIQYINCNYNLPLSLDDVIAKVHISKYYFCRMFHEVTGATFIEYLTKIRLRKVHQMLLETSKPLSEIATATGFSSTSNMSRTFRSLYGTSPSDFRRQNKKNDET